MGRFLKLFFLLFFGMTLFFPAPARAITPEKALEYKKELRAADLEYLSRLKERLLEINTEFVDKAYALRAQLGARKNGSRDPLQHKLFESEYNEKLKQLKTEYAEIKAAVKKDLNGDRLVERGKIRRQYEDEIAGGIGIRG